MAKSVIITDAAIVGIATLIRSPFLPFTPAQIVEALGHMVATADQAREHLALKGAANVKF